MSVDRICRCPYSKIRKAKDGKPTNLGRFRVAELEGNILILQCIKCVRVFRVRYLGAKLFWSDLTSKERSVFRKKKWVSYNGTDKKN